MHAKERAPNGSPLTTYLRLPLVFNPLLGPLTYCSARAADLLLGAGL